MKCALKRLTIVLVIAEVIVLSVNQSAEAGDWFHWHHGHHVSYVSQPATTQSIMLVPTATTTQLRLTPATQLQLGTLTTGQSLQMVPTTGATLTLTPGLTSSIGSLTTSNVTLQGSPNNTIALTLTPQASNNAVGVSVAANGGTDTESQVVALGLALGGGNKSLGDFTKFLEDQAAGLFRQAGSNPSQQAIIDKLFDIATGFLSGNGFGIQIDAIIAPIIKRLIAKVVQRVQPSQPSNPVGPVVPQGGATFEISGRITLTPSQGQGTGPQGGGGNGNGNGGGGTATSLTPGGGQIAPSP